MKGFGFDDLGDGEDGLSLGFLVGFFGEERDESGSSVTIAIEGNLKVLKMFKKEGI